MNPLTVLVDIVPATARKYLYALFALAVLQQGVCAIVGVNTGAEGEVLTYLGGLLGVVAASNTREVSLPELPDSAYGPDSTPLDS